MATAAIDTRRTEAGKGETCSAKGSTVKQGEGLRQYYLQHIHDLQLQVRQKTHNLNRLEAQRNELNSKGTVSVSISMYLFGLPYFTPSTRKPKP